MPNNWQTVQKFYHMGRAGDYGGLWPVVLSGGEGVQMKNIAVTTLQLGISVCLFTY